jgi:hypothetical protein
MSLLIAPLLLVLAPAEAWAWGPITHLAHGSEVLKNLTILSLGLQQLLQVHRLEYLYGCIGADITQARRYTRAQQAHCHSWAVGWAILAHARSDSQRAFAHGYLTHLAGDVYSHNHYVPTQLIVSYPARTLGHLYWEARFDTLQRRAHRDVIGELRARSFPECDAMVRDVVARTLLPFNADKRIFDSFIAVHDLAQWHRMMRRLTMTSRYALPRNVVRGYNAACHMAVVDLLQNGRDSGCQHEDPTGLEALTRAAEVRRTLRALARRKGVSSSLRRAIAALDQRRDLRPAAARLDTSMSQFDISVSR